MSGMTQAPDPLALAAEMLDPPGGGVETYFSDPGGFAENCIRWEPGKGPTAYQKRNMGLLVKDGRLSERGPHGLGKTTKNAWLVLWFALTRDARGIDWKVLTTASAWRQLEKYLWPEVKKWATRLRWAEIGRDPFTRDELMLLGLRLAHGEAMAVACDDPATIEGAHADSLLYIYDEAKTIPQGTFDASEGAFSGAGADTGQEAFAVSSSTPGEPVGRFYDIHARKPGLEDWTAVHVTKAELVKAGRMSTDWASARARQWGPDSAVYQNRVEGEFAASEDNGVIRLAWVELSNERYRALQDYGWNPEERLLSVGADIAESGGDQTVLALRYGDCIREIRKLKRGDVMETTGAIVRVLRDRDGHPVAIVDAVGIGAGIVPRLREQGYSAVGFKGSHKTNFKDASGELLMANTRAASWWHMRDLLDPANGHDIALPPDDELTGDLVAPYWKESSNGRIVIESKDDLRKRIGRSPDVGDAVVQAFWATARPKVSAPAFNVGKSRWAPARQTPV